MNLEQQISKLALDLVKRKHGSAGGEYRSFCEGFPALLRTAGLAQTLAFLSAKGGSPHGDLSADLQSHFEGLQLVPPGRSLLEVVIDPRTETAQYRFFSQVALRVAFWHKRLCQALLEKNQ
jgi:CRISPR/Cas system CMR-associated protein Cmr5 small subunit